MLNDGGLFYRDAGLDSESLSVQCRQDLYAQAEDKQEDWCWPGNSELVDWLQQKGLLSPADCVHVRCEIDTQGENAYAPKHWPACPECRHGRGSDDARPTGRARWQSCRPMGAWPVRQGRVHAAHEWCPHLT